MIFADVASENTAGEIRPTTVECAVTDILQHGIASNLAHTAICHNGESITYAELDAASNRIANYLHISGAKPGDRIGLCLQRSTELVVALVGILKAGCAYVPLDPHYPADRLAMMQADSNLTLLLLHQRDAAQFSNTPNTKVWERISSQLDKMSDGPPKCKVNPKDVAYVIFTSGSTGRPKGIEMPHRALANLLDWQLRQRYFNSNARVLQYSSISFDVSFQEIASTLASGGQLYMVGDDERRDPRRLLDQLHQKRIQRLFLPCVAMRSLIEVAVTRETFPQALAEIITAGEQLRIDPTLRRFFEQIPGSILDNQYGPSETHVITSHCLRGAPERWPDIPPIGMTIDNCKAYILDEKYSVVENGKMGELYLAGRNLAHGYLGRPDLTKQQFITLAIGEDKSQRLYKTGDLASRDSDGAIHYHGRIDHQIKIRGHRIEPGEINAVVADFDGIAHSFTHLRRDTANAHHIVSYFTVSPGAQIEVAALLQHLAAVLPDYMLPTYLLQIDTIPFTPSGKIDLNALPKPNIADDATDSGALDYTTSTERRLADIWSETLKLQLIPREVSFFALGGDSLNAVSLFLKIQQAFNIDLPLATLAQAPTVASLAQHIQRAKTTEIQPNFRSLQTLQKGDPSVTPVFLVHGGLGNVLLFQNLAEGLDDVQPVFAFQWAGWDGCASEQTIEDMAESYKTEMLRQRPNGPYRIGGHCIGGLIAIELCNRLIADGYEIDGPLIVADGLNLHSNSYQITEPQNSQNSLAAFREMVRTLRGMKESRNPDPAEPLPRGLAAWLRKIPLLLPALRLVRNLPKIVRIKFAIALGKKVPISARSYYCYLTQVNAVKQHRSRGYTGDVLYFRSDCVLGQRMGLRGWWNDPFMGYRELCHGQFESQVLGGGHRDILADPRFIDSVQSAFKPESDNKK